MADEGTFEQFDNGPDVEMGSQEEERLMRGVVIDNRTNYILSEVDDAIDHLLVKIETQVMDAAAAGGISPSLAIATTYQRIAMHQLRMYLKKKLKGTALIGPRPAQGGPK